MRHARSDDHILFDTHFFGVFIFGEVFLVIRLRLGWVKSQFERRLRVSNWLNGVCEGRVRVEIALILRFRLNILFIPYIMIYIIISRYSSYLVRGRSSSSLVIWDSTAKIWEFLPLSHFNEGLNLVTTRMRRALSSHLLFDLSLLQF